ncbi:hypothetical protein MMC06_005455 [Schaereria dolodes]|nr:hypothetical protein [Schaereria dolodes]
MAPTKVSIAPKTARTLACLGQAPPSSLSDTPVPELTQQSLAQPAPFPFMDDVVFVAIDLEKACRSHAISEIGLAHLDTRELHGQPPGDRGINWLRQIRATHFRIAGDLHTPSRCTAHWHKGASTHFAYGKSTIIEAHTIRQLLLRWMGSMEVLRRTSEEVAAKTLRHVVLLAWDSTMEEMELIQERVDWYPRVQEAWDIQQARFARRLANRLKKQQGKANLMEMLLHAGIITQFDEELCHLVHNGGNDSVFELQSFVACTLMTAEQQQQFGAQPLPQLPRTFGPQHIQTNQGFPLSKEVEAHYKGRHITYGFEPCATCPQLPGSSSW